MTADGLDDFAVDVVVVERRPMTLTGAELDAAVERLNARGLTYAEIATLCRTDRDTVCRTLDAVRQRALRASRRPVAA